METKMTVFVPVIFLREKLYLIIDLNLCLQPSLNNKENR